MRVKHAAVAYLSTVLYRYFLPFLSLDDEYRICSGMHVYVASMMAAQISPFSLEYPNNGDPQFTSAASSPFVKAAAAAVTAVLKTVLHSFRGVEAFYGVSVEVENSDRKSDSGDKKTSQVRDSRKVLGIEKLEHEGVPCVNCLFKFSDKQRK